MLLAPALWPLIIFVLVFLRVIKTTFTERVNEYGDPTDPYAQLYALESFGLDAEFRQDLVLSDVKDQLHKGYPVPIGILHEGPSSGPIGEGHWVTVVGLDEDYLIVNDPNGELDVLNGGYLNTQMVIINILPKSSPPLVS